MGDFFPPISKFSVMQFYHSCNLKKALKKSILIACIVFDQILRLLIKSHSKGFFIIKKKNPC